MMTAALYPATRLSYLWVCGFWLFIDAMFEVGQHPAISQTIISYIPDVFADIPLLSKIPIYFESGRYDPFDMVSIILGVIIAYGVLLMTEKRDHKTYDEKN